MAQLDLPAIGDAGEDPEYLSRQLITCLGNKRALLEPIGDAVLAVRRRLGGRRLRALDAFAGSGVVSRFLKRHASVLVSNDFEAYAATAARCFLRNRSAVDAAALAEAVRAANASVDADRSSPGFVERLYAPRDDAHITPEDRVFYSRENARRLDAYRRFVEAQPHALKDLLLGPLLSEASIHANTSGVFKGFHKDPRTGVGRFGGGGADALFRILGEIRLEAPVLSRFECDVDVRQADANDLAREAKGLDLAYLDPPYNQHPYGSNYFMLNLLVRYEEPRSISRVSGIPDDWRRSAYNVRAKALPRLRDLVTTLDARFLLVSFNDEGFVRPDEMRRLLAEVGSVQEIACRYNTYRGSRNLAARPIHVTEHLFLVEKS
jgi:adenine-specific DNA-methyltransferase